MIIPVETLCVRILVEGRVQGVGFRYFIQAEANDLGLTGWVRNLGDDRVEILAEGARNDLQSLIETASRGPVSAHVIDTQVTWLESTNKYKKFIVAPSG